MFSNSFENRYSLTTNGMPNKLSQQSCQQTHTTSCTQQPLNTTDSDNVTPIWAIHLMQNLGQQLQNIQQLKGQNQRWQAIEFKFEVSKDAKIRKRYNQVPHLTQDTNGKVTNSQLDTTNESQEVIPFPAGDHKAHINRRAHRHSKHMTEQKHKRSTKEVAP